MLEGRFEHRDSQGHAGKLGPGDLQWMTAGSGVVHSEMPEKEFARIGGRLHGFQLWVNLPRQDKFSNPHYQEIPSSKIPFVANGDVIAKVIAGEAMSTRAIIETRIPIIYVHFILQPGARTVLPVPKEYNIFENNGKQIEVKASKNTRSPFDILLIGGTPINEPVARYGLFVMNTKEEVYQAIQDYRNGLMGSI
jgi:redox-sensitive bicupin YhaK (pirin superfamily)